MGKECDEGKGGLQMKKTGVGYRLRRRVKEVGIRG